MFALLLSSVAASLATNLHAWLSTDGLEPPYRTPHATETERAEAPTKSRIVELDKNKSLPRLKLLIRNNTIVGNVSSLLDAAIVGFAKCATTTLHAWLEAHLEMRSLPNEVGALMAKRPNRLTQRLWELRREALRSGEYVNRSLPKQFYKQPKDTYHRHVLEALETFWPNAKLIYTLRHPVKWFESYWNFRYWKAYHPIPASAIGRKGDIHRIVYNKLHTGLGEYHVFMSMLGKTAQNRDADEWKLMEPFLRRRDNATSQFPFSKIQNQVFLVESSQLSDQNVTRLSQLRHDLSTFLGLSTPLPLEIPHIAPETLRLTPEELKLRDRTRVNICDDDYVALRAELLRIGDAASQWLAKYFMKSDGVHYSSRDYLERVLETWSVDPCQEKEPSMRW